MQPHATKVVLLLSLMVYLVVSPTGSPAMAAVEQVSVGVSGSQGNGECLGIALCADEDLVVFASKASNLVAGDRNHHWDVFVRDRAAGTTELVSVSSEGIQGDEPSGNPDCSRDGRFVVFTSEASNLVTGDTNKAQDVFVRDRLEGKTERVSVSSSGAEGNGASGWYPAISADGRFVAFVSAASNLVAGDTNGHPDVFVRDREQGITERVSVSTAGNQGAGHSGWLVEMSADGRFVVFASGASNLVEEDTNDTNDVFVRDRTEGKTKRVSLTGSGGEAKGACGLPSISADGRFVAFLSDAPDLVEGDGNGKRDVFVRDRLLGNTVRASVSSTGEESDGHSSFCAIRGDGRFVAFHSSASNLVPNDQNGSADVFLRDLVAGTTQRISVGPSAAEGDGDSVGPALSADGRLAAFLSYASNLVPGDTNQQCDVFLWVRSPDAGNDTSDSARGAAP